MSDRIQISGGFYLLAAFALLTVPLRWIIAAILAGVFHELCHCIVIYLLGGRVYAIYVGWRGAVIESDCLSGPKELAAAIAGPVGSFLLLLFGKYLPRTAFCGMIHGMFNLLPCFPLDGGRILRCLLESFLPKPKAQKVEKATQLFFMMLLGGFLLLFRLGAEILFPLLMAVFLRYSENFLAKRGN